jgi:hypothetical protein
MFFAVVVLLILIATIVVAIVFRAALRRMIIAIADFIVILCTILPISLAIMMLFLDLPNKGQVLLVGVGLTVFFCLIAAAFLTLTEIASNTRRMLVYYEPEAQHPSQDYVYREAGKR